MKHKLGLLILTGVTDIYPEDRFVQGWYVFSISQDNLLNCSSKSNTDTIYIWSNAMESYAGNIYLSKNNSLGSYPEKTAALILNMISQLLSVFRILWSGLFCSCFAKLIFRAEVLCTEAWEPKAELYQIMSSILRLQTCPRVRFLKLYFHTLPILRCMVLYFTITSRNGGLTGDMFLLCVIYELIQKDLKVLWYRYYTNDIRLNKNYYTYHTV